MLDATETLVLVSIFLLAAILVVVPRALARRRPRAPDDRRGAAR